MKNDFELLTSEIKQLKSENEQLRASVSQLTQTLNRMLDAFILEKPNHALNLL